MLYIVSTLIFFVVIPPLLMYALGITYNTKKHKIEFDGGVYLQFKPKTAMVTVDGIDYNKQSPFELTDLYPGPHFISLASHGYHTWSKQIRVSPQQTVTFSSINLFPSVLPERTDPNSTDKQPPQSERRDPLNSFVIESSTSGYTVTSTSTNASTTIPLATTTEYWMIPQTLTALLYDSVTERLALVDGSKSSLAIQIFENVKHITSERNTTLFWTPFELWTLNEGTVRPELVTRVSDEIIGATLFDGSYVIYATHNGGVYATELMQLFGRNTHHLASFDSITSISLINDTMLRISGMLTKTSEEGQFSLRLQ